MKTTVHPLTKDDYFDLPETGPRYQLIDGELFMAPSPDRFHQDISRSIFLEVCNHLERSGSGIAYNAPFDVALSEVDVFQPDIAYFSESRIGVLTEHGAEGAPDLVVEILSPSTERYDLYQKRVVYARTGVTELWIVDPKNFEVRVFRLHKDPDTPARLLRFGDVLTSDLLPGFALPVERLFRRF